jgi:hypothetical protein
VGNLPFMTLRPPATFERLKFDPSCPRAWKSTGELVIGFTDSANSKPLLVTSHQREISTWIGLLDGSRNIEDLLLTGSAMGLAHSWLRELLDELINAGHVYSVENVPLSGNSPHLATNLRCDARLIGISAHKLITKRQNLRVLVEGSGQAAFGLVNALSEVQMNVGWRPLNSQRIRAEEIPRDLPAKDFINQKWSQCAKAVISPRLVFAMNESHDLVELENSYPNAIVVPVTVHSRRMAIGPILGAVNSVCASCLHDLRKLNDSDWALLTVQALHQKRALPILSERWLFSLLSLCVNIAVEFADTDQVLDLTSSSLELAPPNPVWQSRNWTLNKSDSCEHSKSFQNA